MKYILAVVLVILVLDWLWEALEVMIKMKRIMIKKIQHSHWDFFLHFFLIFLVETFFVLGWRCSVWQVIELNTQQVAVRFVSKSVDAATC